MKIFRVALLSIYVLAIALVGGGRLWNAWHSNLTNLRLLKGQDVITTSDCSHIWLIGMSAGQRGDLITQRQALVKALGCTAAYISLVQAVLPEDQEMARLATQHYPESSEAWFWLGELTTPGDWLGARQAYLQTVTLAPHNGLAWCRLGANYENNGEFEKASESWLNCCLNGDPGYNGCYGAGQMMERMDNLPQAIVYYRLSRWEGALKRAQELEASLLP